MTVENDIDMSWNNNKELSMIISSIKSPLWIESQDNFENKCFLRELLQKCSGNKVIDMLKKILSVEEKAALVKPELASFFENQAQSFENHMKIKGEIKSSLDEFKIKVEFEDQSKSCISENSVGWLNSDQGLKSEIDAYSEASHEIFSLETDFDNGGTVSKLTENILDDYNCYNCGEVFKDKSSLKKHKLIHSEERIIKLMNHPFVTNKDWDRKIILRSLKFLRNKTNVERAGLLKNVCFLTRNLPQRFREKPNNIKPRFANKKFRKNEKKSNLSKNKEIHKEKKQYQCKSCDKIYDHLSKLTLHQKIHNGEMFTCPCRKKNFLLKENPAIDESKDAFSQNLYQEGFKNDCKLKQSPFECEFCGEKFDDDGFYRNHVKTIHVKQKWVEKHEEVNNKSKVCELCGRNLKVKLFRHMRQAHKLRKKLKKEKQCLICFHENETIKMFYSYQGLRSHIKQKHEAKNWNFNCNLCDSRFLNGNVYAN